MSTPAGWYPHPQMANTLRYWDGQQWTDQVAPVATPARPVKTKNGALNVFVGVLAALVVAGLGVWFVGSLIAQDNYEECVVENADRAIDGLPPRDCD